MRLRVLGSYIPAQLQGEEGVEGHYSYPAVPESHDNDDSQTLAKAEELITKYAVFSVMYST